MIDIILFFIFLSIAVWLVYIRFRKEKDIDITEEPITELSTGTTVPTETAEIAEVVETTVPTKKSTSWDYLKTIFFAGMFITGVIIVLLVLSGIWP